MSSQRIYSRKTMGLDNQVWFVMIGVVVLLEGVFAYKIVNPKKCTPFSFNIGTSNGSKSSFKKGEAVFFTASVNDENISWDFGDNTDNQQGRVVLHRFEGDGAFTVKARLAAGCESEQTINIEKDVIPVIIPIAIYGSDSVQMENELILNCADTASSYDWVVKNHPEIANYGKGPQAKYKFPLPGSYTVEVKLSNNVRRTGAKTVYVTMKSEPKKTGGGGVRPPDEPKCAIVLPNEGFTDLLVKVMNKELQSDNFSQYLCKGDSTRVYVNNSSKKNKQEFSFGEFCRKLSNIKPDDKPKMKITVLQLDKEDQPVRGRLVKGVVTKIFIKLEKSRRAGFVFRRDDLSDYKL